MSRSRERDTKYFNIDFDSATDFELPVTNTHVDEANTRDVDCEWELDGDGEETNAGWLRTIHAENAYYDRKENDYDRNHRNFINWYDMNEAELDTDQATPCNKRYIDFEEQSLFKRIRA